jgi:NADH-quinone oxidoreductase subunit L
MDAIAIIGIATAFFAATIGLAQNDIKKVFAYSTVSQLGYMFLGVGVRRVFRRHLAPDDARVLQSAALPRRGQRDPRALRRAGPAQHGRPAQEDPLDLLDHDVRRVAIAGVPPFSGFFSKDAILAGAAYNHAPWMYWVGVVTAGMTAFYVFRAMFLAFFGDYRGHEHPHESPPVMWVPLAVLARSRWGRVHQHPRVPAPLFQGCPKIPRIRP